MEEKTGENNEKNKLITAAPRNAYYYSIKCNIVV
jgi:hypothetical protein